MANNEDRGRVMSTVATLFFWSNINGCRDDYTEQRLPDLEPDHSSVVDRLDLLDCEAPVVLLRVEGGGHRVPGDRILFGSGLVDALLGVQNDDIRAAEQIWTFFKNAEQNEGD
ncbi:MAG: hypothetical protein P8Q36_18190 [Alphaproteobacteria bacterium]|nr:hypothetical protein [Rhodospirillaceae bacterium]MBT6204374.1 hypothetical protein [Rhodospirillaceae bacterium]MBT6509462.1 hypothetical protein [Rhodospirillaceae bacterium]MBT7613347.1 hypothetical protein [Rhodospirillaceae bacterium]MDG2482773.1 hypothetical protein [Alphaproteobacteria bacterium]